MADASPNALLFLPAALDAGEREGLPTSYHQTPCAVVHQRHVYRSPPTSISRYFPLSGPDRRTSEGKAQRWAQGFAARLGGSPSALLSLGWAEPDDTESGRFVLALDSLRAAFLDKYKSLRGARSALARDGFACVELAIRTANDPATLGVPQDRTPVMEPSGYLLQMAGGDGVSGFLDVEAFSCDPQALREMIESFEQGVYEDERRWIFDAGVQRLTRYERGRPVAQVDLGEHMSWVTAEPISSPYGSQGVPVASPRWVLGPLFDALPTYPAPPWGRPLMVYVEPIAGEGEPRYLVIPSTQARS